jgi:hypothetical protein
MEVTKWLKPSISVSRIGDSASVQADPTAISGKVEMAGRVSEEYAELLHRMGRGAARHRAEIARGESAFKEVK